MNDNLSPQKSVDYYDGDTFGEETSTNKVRRKCARSPE